MELLEEVSQPGCDKLEIFENSARQSHNRCDLLLETILTEAGGWTGQPPRSLSSNKHLYHGVALTQIAQKKNRQQLPMPTFLITEWKWFMVLHLPTSSGHFWMHPSTAAQPQMVHGHYTAPQSWYCSANTPERCASAAAGFYNSPVFPRLAW